MAYCGNVSANGGLRGIGITYEHLMLLEDSSSDEDGDGTPDYLDRDLENDGIPDELDLDVDGDGLSNTDEAAVRIGGPA